MGTVYSEIPPPAHWQDFELITLEIARLLWKNDYAERNGRSGQEQKGVDVVGYNYVMNEQSGIQCKKRKRKVKGIEAPSHSLTTEEIDAEFKLCGSLSVPLKRFIIATTGELDEKLQEHARKISGSDGGPQVSLWFWDTFVEKLNANTNLMYCFYENVLAYRQQYSGDEHYHRMLAMAFDRPAIRTAFHLENGAKDFITAISHLHGAIATGVLKDRDERIIDQVRVPGKKAKQLGKIQKLLQKTRDIATAGLKSGDIQEQGNVIEVRNRQIIADLNNSRSEAVALLNEVLKEKGIDEVDFVDY
jgi:hypothetical protein